MCPCVCLYETALLLQHSTPAFLYAQREAHASQHRTEMLLISFLWK